MQKRKTKVIDGKDKEILKTLYEKRPLAGRQIARRVGITASAIAPRLNNLEEMGILKKSQKGIRNFSRKMNKEVVKIRSPKCIMWDLDIKY